MTISQIYKKFPDHKACIKHLENAHWKNGAVCPYCGSSQSSPLPLEQRHHCNICNTTYSVTVKTIFHNTKIDLQKWFLGISFILNSEKEISVRQLARGVKVDKNTAWFMSVKIRKALLTNGDFLRGIIGMR
jgi:transposase-like protein